MSSIGGLDVSYGARHQIVRTNLAVVEATTTQITKAQAKSMHDLFHMGLSHSILNPDFIVFVDGTTGTEGAGTAVAQQHLLTTDFQVDTTGNGSVDSTMIADGPLLRDARQMPLSVNSSPEAVGELSAQDALVADVAASGSVVATQPAGNLVLESVIGVGACLLSGTVGTATAGTSAFNIGEENPGTGSNEGLVVGAEDDEDATAEFTLGDAGVSGIMSAAMAQAVSQMEGAADYGVAGQPEAQVGLLNLGGIVEDVQEHLTAVNVGGNLGTLLTAHATNGRSQAGASGTSPTFTNMLSATSTASTVGAATAIVSVTTIAKVL